MKEIRSNYRKRCHTFAHFYSEQSLSSGDETQQVYKGSDFKSKIETVAHQTYRFKLDKLSTNAELCPEWGCESRDDTGRNERNWFNLCSQISKLFTSFTHAKDTICWSARRCYGQLYYLENLCSCYRSSVLSGTFSPSNYRHSDSVFQTVKVDKLSPKLFSSVFLWYLWCISF